jgi:tRNA-2-methylthio-N6-dimethylallyladenosine synthase
MDQLPEAVRDERLQRLQAAIERHQTAFNAACVGKVLPVLLERAGRHPGQLVGRSPYMQWVHLGAEASLCGHVLEVEIHSAGAKSLGGRLQPGMTA